MGQRLQQQLKELGSKLGSPPTSKDALIKLLKQAAACLSEIEQSPPKLVVESMQPLINAISTPVLLKHQDREVKLFVASCACEITRISAPEAPYHDDVLKDIFQLIVNTLGGLSDATSSSFGRRVVVLETLARYRSCVMMLDLECDNLINEMFSTFFHVVRDDHPDNVLSSMESIMEVLLEESEDLPDKLLLILLAELDEDKKDANMAARRLAKNVIQKCAAKLETSIRQFLVSAMSGDSKPMLHGISYHGVLYNVYCCAPQVVSGVIPYLTGELLSDHLEARLKAVRLVGNLVSLPGSTISEVFKPVFMEFVKRLTDRAVEVRMSLLEHARICLLENPSRPGAHQIISALSERFLDYDENVRKQVVSVICDVACHSPTSIPIETIKLLAERLRDKSLPVKKYTLERLADIHQSYFLKHFSDSRRNEDYGWIVGKVLRSLYDKDFRSDAIEPVLSLSLYPARCPVDYKVKYWVRVFSGFETVEVKALEKILEQKQRLQQEMQKYLSLWQLSQQEVDRTEIQKKENICFRVMSRCFTDPNKAEENFRMLNQLKDPSIWKILAQLLDPNTRSLQAIDLRGELLRKVGEKHQLFEFLSILSLKCSYILFDKIHVSKMFLEAGVQKSSGNTELILSCMTILVILARFCPSLLQGAEADLLQLLEDDNEIIKEGVLHILAKAGGTIRENIGVSSCSLNLILERICIEGSRRQAKYAVHALASVTKDDGLMSLSVLYKRLVDMLEETSHLPAILQSLGCIAQAAIPVFETRENEVVNFIKENILKLGQIEGNEETLSWDNISEHCSLKIFGIKTLVKSYLPVKDAHLRSGIDDVIGILKNILVFGDISSDIMSSSVDKAHLKLGAAKAVLRLSKPWEHKIPVDVFYLTLRISEDKFPEVKKILFGKIHQYARDHILDPKYACAFLDISSSETDLEENKRYLSDIIQSCQQERARQASLPTDSVCPMLYPEHILIYVIHSIANHPSFPNIDECKDVKRYEPMYRQLYTFLSMLILEDKDGKADFSNRKDKDSISLLISIILSIKHSEDAFDSDKSKNSYALCDLAMGIIKRLAPVDGDLQNFGPLVTLPPLHYKKLEKQEENNSQVDGQKTWLENEDVLAHFESLAVEANAIAHSTVSQDDVIDSENEASEMPLGKLMKRLKAKAAKMKKEAKHEAEIAQEGSEKEGSGMVHEENHDSHGTTSKFQWSNGHGNARKRRSGLDPHKKKRLKRDSEDAPATKYSRASAQDLKSSASPASKGSKRIVHASRENLHSDLEGSDEESQPVSEDQNIDEKTPEPSESELLFSRIRKKLSSSKQKGKGLDRNVEGTPEAKKPKKISNSGGASMIRQSSTGSMKKEKSTGIGKCTTKENGRPVGDIVGRKIKVWWPIDKRYYGGTVKSFDVEKKKHVILYDDGDVEVLRLDKELWELVAERSTPKKAHAPKGIQSRGSSVKKQNSSGSSKSVKKSEETSLSQTKRKRTPREYPKEPKTKAGKSKGSDETRDGTTSMSLGDDSEPEKGSKKKFKKSSLSSVGKKQYKGDHKESSDAAEGDSEDTETDDIASHSNTQGSDNEVVSAFERKGKASKDESEQETEENDSAAMETHSADAEISDDEPLSQWKQRCGKKRGQ